MLNQVHSLLNDSLNPSLAPQTLQNIHKLQQQDGFVTQLLIVADDHQCSLSIRQSALVVLKNLIYDEKTVGRVMRQNDVQMVKSSILEALIRNGDEAKLTPTFRQIIHLLAEKDYPQKWPDIVPRIIENIVRGDEFRSVASSVQALKAIVSVCGNSAVNQITLNNLANKIVQPLFLLTGKLFSNYSSQILPILVSIFKIFHLSIFFHLPQIVANNMHSLMIFVKQILQLDSPELVPLKTICLKLINRLYSRHTCSTVQFKWLKFANDFHDTYSSSFFQTFVAVLLNPTSTLEMVGYALSSISCIKKNHEPTEQIINNYKEKIIKICLQRYKLSKNLKIDKIQIVKEERLHFLELVEEFFNDSEGVLGFLMDQYTEGDIKAKQVVLHLYVGLGQKIKECPNLHGSMASFLMNFIVPNLQPNNQSLIRAKGCELIANYNFIQLPEHGLESVFSGVYGCLNEQDNPYLIIYAVTAFSQLINRYDKFLNHIIPYLSNILSIYTNLLKQTNIEISPIIKSLQILLGKIDGKDLQPFAIDLIKFLLQMFYDYRRQQPTKSNEENSDDLDDDEDENFINSGQGCLASIRQILSADNLSEQFYASIEEEIVFPLFIHILQDKELLFLEEGLNIVNLLMFKKKTTISTNFNNFLPMILYCFVGIPSQLANININEQYKTMLTNLCVEPDENMLENSIGLIRNYIAKLGPQLRDLRDEVGKTYLQYLFNVVSCVHESKNEDGYVFSASDRSIALTIYVCLIEYKVLREDEFSLILNNLLSWLHEAIKVNETLYIPIYVELIMIANYYSPQIVSNAVNIEWILPVIFDNFPRFVCEYQLQRILVGFCKVIECGQVKNESMMTELMRRLLPLAETIMKIRTSNEEGRSNGEDVDMEEQAEEDLIAENTHLGLLQEKQMYEKEEEKYQKECQEVEWDEEYNKLYQSPFLQVDELTLLTETLKNSQFRNLLSMAEQQSLSEIIRNTPPKKY